MRSLVFDPRLKGKVQRKGILRIVLVLGVKAGITRRARRGYNKVI